MSKAVEDTHPCSHFVSNLRVKRELLVNGQANVCMQDFFEFDNASQTRIHPYKLYKRHSYSSVRTSYFAVRVINVWNTLPVDRVDFSSFAAFKWTVQRIDYRCFHML